MKKAGFNKIETKLKIKLPAAYVTTIVEKGERLENVFDGDDSLSYIFVSPDQVVSVNKTERKSDSATTEAFPNWWKDYLLVGTNGAGDFFCLRLDNKPGVWAIGSDGERTKMASSFNAFITGALKKYEKETKKSASSAKEVADEADAERKAIKSARVPNAKEWLEATSVTMLNGLLKKLKKRLDPAKLRRFGIACCRLIPNVTKDKDCVAAIELAEQRCHGKVSQKQIAAVRERLKAAKAKPSAGFEIGTIQGLLQSDTDYLNHAPVPKGGFALANVGESLQTVLGFQNMMVFADLMREVAGNPWLPPSIKPEWKTKKVLTLATTIDKTGEFSRMSELADELAAAGCDDARVLAHCKKKGQHVAGCWVIDEVLGRATFVETGDE